MITPRQNGFAMIEIMVTAVILAIGISGMGVLLLKSIQSSQDNSQKSQGMWIVQDLVGRMRANSEGMRAKAYETSGAVNCTQVKMCSDYNDDGFKSSESCTTREMANFDRWITACGVSAQVYDAASDTYLYDSPADSIINPELNVTCTDTTDRTSSYSGEDDCVRYFIELTWDTKLQQGAPDAADRTFKSQFSMVMESN
jgi:type IV pilus modification protein PilV